MFAPLKRHWYESGAVPVTVTLNEAAPPATTDWLAGWPVMLGATGAGLTVRLAAALVTAPATLLTRTE